MNLKINYSYIGITIFTFFFFFWGVTLNDFNDLLKSLNIYALDKPHSLILNKIKLSHFILLSLIPIFYGFIKKRNFHPKELFNNQKYIIFFILFIIAHYFFVKVYYNTIIDKSEIANLAYLVLLSVIYCHYRNFIFLNFKKILTVYLIIFVFFSIYETSQFRNYNIGQCHRNIFLIQLIQDYLKISLSNSIYLENSHLAMMSIAVFFSCVYILVRSKKINILFLLLFSIEVIIVLNNLSTTYFVCYFFAQITLLLFFLKRINIKFWIVTILLLLINSYLFFSDKNCTVKVTDFKVNDVINENLIKSGTNLTTLIYKRSAILALQTLKDQSLGWGIDGMNNATQNFMSKYNTDLCFKNRISGERCSHKDIFRWYGETKTKRAHWSLRYLNTKDGLSNSLKMITEFGIFSFIIIFIFIKYILNIRNINSYNVFIIILFVTMCIRGVGYFNGGFIFCLLEFFYYKKFSMNLNSK